jgi:hypothetical protein
MAPIPSREELEAMKRADLQKLCKVCQHHVNCRLLRIHSQDFGVKANLKTEALIDLLLNEIKWGSYAIHNNSIAHLCFRMMLYQTSATSSSTIRLQENIKPH